MKYHKGEEPPIIPQPLRSKEMKLVCSDENDAAYIDKIAEKKQELYDLILAANYMDIKSLLHLGCAKVASLIKGPEKRKTFSLFQASAPAPPLFGFVFSWLCQRTSILSTLVSAR